MVLAASGQASRASSARCRGSAVSAGPAAAAVRAAAGSASLRRHSQRARAYSQGRRTSPAAGGAVGAALGVGEDLAEGGDGGVVVAQHRQAVGEHAVQVGLVAREGQAGDGLVEVLALADLILAVLIVLALVAPLRSR
ncbi:hypothetical protein GCM10020000_36190 [Streptomyces olivoverticillatus]